MSASLPERFMARFRGLERAHGTYQTTGKRTPRGKVEGRARTFKEPVTLVHWTGHLAGEVGVGIIPVTDDGFCRFAAIDVDVYDLNLEHLEARVQEAELPLVLCRTKSGGAHLYLFLSEAVKASLVREKMMEWAIVLGYPKVEVFPKQSELASENDVGSWINMPYFGGAKSTRYAIAKGKALTPEEFLTHAAETAITTARLSGIEGKTDPTFDDAPPCLQHLARQGFPEGTRNQALFNLAVFAKMKFKDDWQDRVREMNRGLLQPPLGDAEVTNVIKQIGKKDYFYTCKQQPIVDSCNRSICVKRTHGISGSNGDPGISLDGLVKHLTDPPTYYVNVNGRRVHVESSADLMLQNRFVLACMDQINVIPKKVKENDWRDLISALMAKVEEVEAPEDAGIAGQFWHIVEEFCTTRNVGESMEDVALEKAYSREGRTFFYSPTLLAYAERRKVRVGPHRAWAILREHAGECHRFRVKGKVLRVWSVTEFPKVDFGPVTPKVIDDTGDDLI